MACVLPVSAQTYLDHLQTHEVGKGTVTVHQSLEIDKLVNGTNPMVSTVKKTTTQSTKVEKKVIPVETPEVDKEETEAPVAETNKKTSVKIRKVVGYRVQVFAGGNTRQDKAKATAISNEIKAQFPEMPVYCHFYSPRWICRMGNFTSQQEAQTYLRKVRALGYSQASIVKGMIPVRY